jgi:L-threonylcarbamoyladenylate synthase
MKTYKWEQGSQPGQWLDDVTRTLEEGGLVCLPCNGTYRIIADLKNPDAVNHLIHSKRRVGKAPSLVFIADVSWLEDLVAEVEQTAEALVDELWPGPLTILFEPNGEVPRVVAKQLSKTNGKIGVRIPESDLMGRVVAAFGGPVLASSANKDKKHGESSPAQVRKNFVGRVDIFIDAGDLREAPPSTVVDIKDGKVSVVRAGAIAPEKIGKALKVRGLSSAAP